MHEMQVAIPGKTKLQQGHIDQLNLRFDCVHNVPRAAIFYFLGVGERGLTQGPPFSD